MLKTISWQRLGTCAGMSSILSLLFSVDIFGLAKHVKVRQPGYNQENHITISYNAELGRNCPTLKQDLLSRGVVESVTKSDSPITDIYSNNSLHWTRKTRDLKVIFPTIATECDYTKTMAIRIPVPQPASTVRLYLLHASNSRTTAASMSRVAFRSSS